MSVGNFSEAVKWQQNVVESFDGEDLVNQEKERLQMFRDGKPFRR